MEVRPGYKQTEVGVIPQDWETREIRSVCKLINGRGFKPFEWKTFGLPIIRIQNLNGSDEYNYFVGSYDRKLEVSAGQLLFAWSGSRGTSFGPHLWPGPLGLLNYHTWKVQIDESEISPEFFFHALKKLTEVIEGRAHGASALVHTQKWEMEGFVFPTPPDQAEQRAIAEALSDVDALLDGLDRLIAKKRDLKQATMQQLLTGRTRLPGFNGEWGVRDLGPLGSISGAGVDKKIRPGEPPVRLVNYMDVYRRSFIRSTDLDHVVSASPEQAARCAVRKGDIFFTPSSEMPFDIAASAVAVEDIPDACYSYHVVRLRLNEDWDLRFRAYAFKTQAFLDQAARTSEGSGVRYVITQGKFRQLTIRYPSDKAEQTAIAAVLSDMDAELAELGARRDKTRDLKQAMMQELLTGKTRLVDPARESEAIC